MKPKSGSLITSIKLIYILARLLEKKDKREVTLVTKIRNEGINNRFQEYLKDNKEFLNNSLLKNLTT